MNYPSMMYLLAGLAAVFTAGCGTQNAPAGQGGMPPAAVTVVQVTAASVPIYSDFVGSTFAEQEVQVHSRVNGYITARHFNPGDIVNPGQLIYSLDPATYQAEVDRLRAEVVRAEAQLRFAREGVEVIRAESEFAQAEANQIKADQDVNRVRPLVQQKALPEQDLDAAVANQSVNLAMVRARKAALEQQRLSQKSQIEQGMAALASAKASLALAELNLSYTRIQAPLLGRIGETSVQTGGLATATATTPLTRISPLDPIYVEFKVGERDYLDYIRREIAKQRSTGKGQVIEPLQLVLADGTLYDKPGQYQYADRAVDIQTGTLKLIGTFPNPDRMLLPGQFSRIRLRTGFKEGVFLVPQRAVMETQGLRQVLLVDGQNKVSQRTVTATDRVGSNWVIEAGLAEGNRVVVEGLQKAIPGSKVEPKLVALTEVK